MVETATKSRTKTATATRTLIVIDRQSGGRLIIIRLLASDMDYRLKLTQVQSILKHVISKELSIVPVIP
ncbi:hypothetical protein AKJ16_DCAP19917 [Drosera capensis]